jgi:hypothetical protein
MVAKSARFGKIAAGAILTIVTALVIAFIWFNREPHAQQKDLGTPVPVPATGAGVYWGMHRDPSAYGKGFSSASREAVLTDAEARLGRKFDIDHQFYRWGDALPNAYLRWTAAQGRYPFISLIAVDRGGKPVQWADIASGKQDHYLSKVAKGIKQWGRSAYFSFHHEPEHEICPDNNPINCDRTKFNGTTEDYQAAWRHIVGLFRAAGVTNLSYVWITTGSRFTNPKDYRYGPNLYPGSDVIDWIASDPYNFPAARGGVVDYSRWKSLGQLIGPWYRWSIKTGKPLMLGEFGCRTDPSMPDRRAQWFAQAERELQTDFPQIKAVDYYDNSPRDEPGNDWRLFTSDTAGLAVFRAWGLNAHFDTRH